MPKIENPNQEDRDLGPDLTPKADFFGFMLREGDFEKKGFGVNGYWQFGKNLAPRILVRMKIGGVMWRLTLRPVSKESHPGKGVMERHLRLEAARVAADYGRPMDEPEEK